MCPVINRGWVGVISKKTELSERKKQKSSRNKEEVPNSDFIFYIKCIVG
jgi:hypothetical protein